MGRCCRMVVAVVTYPCQGPSHPDGHGSLLQDGCCCCYLLLSRTQPPRWDTGRCYRMVVAVVTYPVQDPATQTGHGSLLQDCARTFASGSQSPSVIIAPCTSRHFASRYLTPLPQVAEHWKGRRFEFIWILTMIEKLNRETRAGMRRYWMSSFGLSKEMIRCKPVFFVTELSNMGGNDFGARKSSLYRRWPL